MTKPRSVATLAKNLASCSACGVSALCRECAERRSAIEAVIKSERRRAAKALDEQIACTRKVEGRYNEAHNEVNRLRGMRSVVHDGSDDERAMNFMAEHADGSGGVPIGEELERFLAEEFSAIRREERERAATIVRGSAVLLCTFANVSNHVAQTCGFCAQTARLDGLAQRILGDA